MNRQEKIPTEELDLVAGGAFPTAVDHHITDAVSQVNAKVLGDSPAMAMGSLFVATGQALSNAAHNATTAQQQTFVTMQAATTQGVSELLSMDMIAAETKKNPVS